MARNIISSLCLVLLILISGVSSVRFAWAQEEPQALAERAINLLSYIAVDYADAVAEREVRDPRLYRQLQRQADMAEELLQQLPDKPGRTQLAGALRDLNRSIEQRDSADNVRRRANAAADRLAALYQLPRSPAEMLPPAKEAEAIYTERCAHCHGPRGTPGNAKGSDLRNRERMARFSLYDLYNTLDPARDDAHGHAIDGDLSSRERWALAVLVAGFSAPAEMPEATLAEKYPALVGLPGIAVTRPSELPVDAAAALGWWRANPDYTRRLQHPIVRAAGLIQLAQTSYRAGDPTESYHQLMLALREGFAPARLGLEERNSALASRLDQQWLDLRRAILDEAPTNEVIEKFQRLQAGVLRAREVLQPAPERGPYGWAALLFALALALGGLLWKGLRRRSRR
ncbi:c-type cytochrome [Microbulbifer aggregans]|uniref:c-type cytochrome n=1 Tax=Microbulbifer aggregans TaxID=1769779 RepID=UPI001CFCDE26|nr:cytochrome c [Microbulbifer aggregans]